MDPSGKNNFAVSGVILAGGHSRRFATDKSQVVWNGKKLFDHALDSLPSHCTDRVAVVREGQDHSLFPGIRLACDDLQLPPCPLRGVIAGLEASTGSLALVMACDTPLIKVELWNLLVKVQTKQTPNGSLVAVPLWEGKLNPLVACYSVGASSLLRQVLLDGERSLFRAVLKLPHTVVTESQLKSVDPQGLSFKNVNTPDELELL